MATYKAKSLKHNEDFYEFIPPAPTETERGGIIASEKTDTETQEVKLGSDGKLYTAPIPTKMSELTNDSAFTSVTVDSALSSTSTNPVQNKVINAEFDAITETMDALQDEVDAKAAASDLTYHTGNSTVHITSAERTKWNDAYSKEHEHSNKTVLDNTTASYTTDEKTKLSGIATGAEVNQNAFSNVKVGDTTVAADAKTDTLTLAGSNVTLTPDATNDKVTIGITKANVVSALGYTPPTSDTVYTHPSYTERASGLYKIIVDGTGHVSEATAVTKSDITALGIPSSDTNTHYTSKNVVGATTATSNTSTALTNGNVYLNSVENGSVTSSHKISGSGATTVTTDTSGNIVVSSTNTTYSAAGSSLGLVKSGGDVTISSGVITVNDDSHAHTIANVDDLQSTLDSKQATITGGATTITSSNLTTGRALISDSNGKVAVSAVTSTELGYLDGVTSNVQTQLDSLNNSLNNKCRFYTTDNDHQIGFLWKDGCVVPIIDSTELSGFAFRSDFTVEGDNLILNWL